MTPTQDEIRQMVERLRAGCPSAMYGDHRRYDVVALERIAIDAADLLSRLAQQEPVAWRIRYELDSDGWYIVDSPNRPAYVEGWEPLYAAPVPVAQQEPVAWLDWVSELVNAIPTQFDGRVCQIDDVRLILEANPYAAPVPAPKE